MQWKNGVKYFVFFVAVVAMTDAYAQQDTLSSFQSAQKRPYVALGEGFFLNVLLNRVDYHILKADWAKVDPITWNANLKKGLEWDWDRFGNNFFGHPYGGSLYYNAARSLDMNYWESAPYAFIGSITWEYLGENLSASGNDLITTTLGGIQLGEMSFRLSNYLRSRPSHGLGRVWKVGLATILDPISSINNWLFNGNFKKQSQYSKYIDFPITGSFSVGINFPLKDVNVTSKGSGSFINFDLQYGNWTDDDDFYRPFEFFEIRSWLRFTDVDDRAYPYLNITSEGILWGRSVSINSESTFLYGVFQHFDFLHDEVIEIGSLGVSLGTHYYRGLSQYSSIRGQFHIGPVLLGGANNELVSPPHNYPDAFRDYNFATGFFLKTQLVYNHQAAGRLTTEYRRINFYLTLQPKGIEKFNLLTFMYEIPVWKGHRVGFNYTRYFRRYNYYNYSGLNNFNKDIYEFRLFISYVF